MVAQCGRVSVEEPCDMGNVVVIDSVVAGVGTSTLAALLARELSERASNVCSSTPICKEVGWMCFLAWKTRTAHASGKSARPLGNIDGKALLRELPIWDGVPLLACDPWKTENPQSWEVQACIHALSQVRSVVVVDMGQWNGLQDLTELRKAIRITVVELTVLGLARAKANLRAHHGSIGEHDAATQEREFLVGVQPRGTVRDHGTTAIEEAAEYLDCDITAVIKPDAKLCSELLEGLGLRKPNRTNAKAIATLADLIQEALEEKSISHGTRAT